jgi:mediator of replication checkpoint protein 1
MVLRKDFSVVADSEMASSPSSESSPQPVRRAARTYGRRRDDPDTSLTYSEPDSSDSIYRTGPPDIQDEVPASEPSGLPDTDNEGEDEDEDMLPSLQSRPRFTFGWREKMKEVDDNPSMVDGVSRVDDERASPNSQDVVDTNVDRDRTRPEGRPLDVFNNASSCASASHDDAHLSLPPPHFTLKPPRTRLRNQKNIALYDSDTDNDNILGSRSSSPRTPLLHPIATPKSHCTSSPPTSHHEVSTNSRESSASKGKGKNYESQLSVAPAPYSPHGHEGPDGFPDSTQSQSTVKPTKKKIKVSYRLCPYILLTCSSAAH